MSEVPSFTIDFSAEEKVEMLGMFSQILDSGDLTLGPLTPLFEAEMKKASGTDDFVAVNSGATALQILYRSLNVENKKVLIPTNTNFATAAAAVYAGGIPELYDSGLYPDFEDIKRRMSPQVGAVALVHIGGYVTPEIEEIAAFCKEAAVPLIEDAAHAHGAFMNDQPAGSFGTAAAFSFFLTKNITTAEGGGIASSHELAAQARQYRVQGKAADGRTHTVWGNSWRMTEFGAAMGIVQLKKLETDTNNRARVMQLYANSLHDTGLIFPTITEGSRPSGHKAIAMLPEGVQRQAVRATMLAQDVRLARGVYEDPLHTQPVFAPYAAAASEYPIADSFAEQHICLPLWRSISDAQVEQVIKAARYTMEHCT